MKRGAVVVVAGVAAAALLGGGVWWWLASRTPGPDAVASGFLAALESGDAAGAAALLAEPPDGVDLAAAYAGASERISAPEVTGIGGAEGASARASARFTLAGDVHEVTFALVGDDVTGWRIGPDALGEIVPMPSLGDTVAVGDAVVGASAPVALLPGVYEVRASPAALLDGGDVIEVTPGSRRDAVVAASLSPAATAIAQEQLDDYADTCAARVDAVPESCGIRVPWAADLASLERIAFRIETYPALVLRADGTGFDATGGVIVATATGTTRTGDRESFTYRADDWALRGSMRFEDEALVLSVR